MQRCTAKELLKSNSTKKISSIHLPSEKTTIQLSHGPPPSHPPILFTHIRVLWQHWRCGADISGWTHCSFQYIRRPFDDYLPGESPGYSQEALYMSRGMQIMTLMIAAILSLDIGGLRPLFVPFSLYC